MEGNGKKITIEEIGQVLNTIYKDIKTPDLADFLMRLIATDGERFSSTADLWKGLKVSKEIGAAYIRILDDLGYVKYQPLNRQGVKYVVLNKIYDIA